ncbi:MAG: DegV family EDD domain-containing protein, partial [Clostridiales bacterium]|nr:DegV family EDD domain-containing protein [Clostridiales bacterium]
KAAAALQDIANRTQYIVMANDLFHLRRGGRISVATAMVGTMLQIKPLFTFNRNGKLCVTEKIKGQLKAMHQLVKIFLKNTAGHPSFVYIAQADCAALACELRAMIQDECPQAIIKIGYIGPVIGTHTGPGTLGFGYLCPTEKPVIKQD